jgi:hypothetical protein
MIPSRLAARCFVLRPVSWRPPPQGYPRAKPGVENPQIDTHRRELGQTPILSSHVGPNAPGGTLKHTRWKHIRRKHAKRNAPHDTACATTAPRTQPTARRSGAHIRRMPSLVKQGHPHHELESCTKTQRSQPRPLTNLASAWMERRAKSGISLQAGLPGSIGAQHKRPTLDTLIIMRGQCGQCRMSGSHDMSGSREMPMMNCFVSMNCIGERL